MKVLHYSDNSSKEFARLYRQADVLVATGDLSVFDFPGIQDPSISIPAVGVYGNHCSGTYFDKLGIENLHNRVVELSNHTWGGFQGCLRYKNNPLLFTEADAIQFANTFPPVEVLLLHAGPEGMLDDPSDPVHVGSPAIAKYVRDKQPKYVFCGHQYSDAYLEVGRTKIYRTYGARLIEIDL